MGVGGRYPRPRFPEVPLGIRSHLQGSAPGGRPRGAGCGAGPKRATRDPWSAVHRLPLFLICVLFLPQPH